MINVLIALGATACIVDIGYYLFRFISIERITREAMKCLKNGNFEVRERKEENDDRI